MQNGLDLDNENTVAHAAISNGSCQNAYTQQAFQEFFYFCHLVHGDGIFCHNHTTTKTISFIDGT